LTVDDGAAIATVARLAMKKYIECMLLIVLMGVNREGGMPLRNQDICPAE